MHHFNTLIKDNRSYLLFMIVQTGSVSSSSICANFGRILEWRKKVSVFFLFVYFIFKLLGYEDFNDL